MSEACILVRILASINDTDLRLQSLSADLHPYYKPQLQDYEPSNTPAVRVAQGERAFHPFGYSLKPVRACRTMSEFLPVQLSFLVY